MASFVSLCNSSTTERILEKDRIFDPTLHPQYANHLGLPSLLMQHNPQWKITHLRFGPDYNGDHMHDGVKRVEIDTVVMIVGGREIDGHTAAARWFAEESIYNRNSFVGQEPLVNEILSTTCIGELSDRPILYCTLLIFTGLNSIREIFDKRSTIKKAFVVTSSITMIEAIKKLYDWTKDGFPDVLPGGMSSMLIQILRGHLSAFDKTGHVVKFWLVAPEHITRPTFNAENQLLDFFKAPHDENTANCHCGNCMDEKQYKEAMFAKVGMPCCACPFGVTLSQKYGHLKKGDKFVTTNNAGVTAATVEMLVDAKAGQFQFPLGG